VTCGFMPEVSAPGGDVFLQIAHVVHQLVIGQCVAMVPCNDYTH
jgi:hypothetical protein